MKRNCLFTVNIGNFVTNYVRDHMLSACERWNCDYAEIHDYVRPGYASCSKYVGPERLAGYEKLLMLDGDILVSGAAPNPFDFCTEEDVFLAVSDYMQTPNHCPEWINGPYTIGTEPLLKAHPEFHAPPYETVFNGGFWMCFNTPIIRKMFSRALALIPDRVYEEKGTFYLEQGAINIMVHNLAGVKLCLLPETWNHIIPQDCEPGEYYMNHFGGWAHDLLKRKAHAYDVARIG